MTPDGKGRFCQHCQKTVIDFSRMSDQEIAAIVNSSKGELCGRFLTSQLEREIGTIKRHTPLRKIAAVISALALSVPAASAMQSKAATTQSPVEKDMLLDTTTTIVITGCTSDSVDQSILPGTTVIIKGTSIGTNTNAEGKFTLRVPSDMIGKEVILRTLYIGFITKEIPVVLKENIIDLNISLVRIDIMDSVVMVGAVSRRLTLWGRIKLKVSNLFH